MSKHRIYCVESWHINWEWLPRNWYTFGWHTLELDGITYKTLNLDPLSIHNDWTPVEEEEESDHG